MITRWRQSLILCAVLSAVTFAAACSESLDGGAACPALCPTQGESFRDTTLNAVVLDTTVTGFPTLGLSALMLLANRPDTIVTRAVLRFDELNRSYYPNKGDLMDTISAVDSVFLKLPLDSTGRLGTTPVTINVFDVDTTQSDSVTSVVSSLFRPDRRIGSITVIPSLTGDTLRVPLSKTVIAKKIVDLERLRVGLEMTGGVGQLRLVAFRFSSSAPILEYDASTDTVYAPITVLPKTSIPGVTVDQNLAYQSYTMIVQGSPPPAGDQLVAGGYPASRFYLRFQIPAYITDSSTIVRAELLLTQRPSMFGAAHDSVAMVALVPATTDAVTDLRRVLDMSAEGSFAAIDSIRFLPADSGAKVINVLTLVRTWRTLPTQVPRALAFRINREGAQASELRFFSSRAPLMSLRPRLRITYLPRSEFALP